MASGEAITDLPERDRGASLSDRRVSVPPLWSAINGRIDAPIDPDGRTGIC